MTNKCKYFCMGTPRPMACMNQTMLCRLIFSLSNYNFIHIGSIGIPNEYVCEMVLTGSSHFYLVTVITTMLEYLPPLGQCGNFLLL